MGSAQDPPSPFLALAFGHGKFPDREVLEHRFLGRITSEVHSLEIPQSLANRRRQLRSQSFKARGPLLAFRKTLRLDSRVPSRNLLFIFFLFIIGGRGLQYRRARLAILGLRGVKMRGMW